MGLNKISVFFFKKGVTLTELLVAMGIAGGVSLGIVSIYMAHYRIFTNQNALIEAETQNKLAMDQILKYSKETSIFSYITGSSSSELGLSLLPLDPSGNPYDPGQNDHVIFYRDSATKRLLRKGCSDAVQSGVGTSRPDQVRKDKCNISPITKVVASGVTTFTITDYNDPDYTVADQAKITLTTESKTISGRIFTSTQTATIYIRK